MPTYTNWGNYDQLPAFVEAACLSIRRYSD